MSKIDELKCVLCDKHRDEPLMTRQVRRPDEPFALHADKNGIIGFHISCVEKYAASMKKLA